MWCSCCRKNVTGAISGQHDSICCSRCGTPLPGELPAAASNSGNAASPSDSTPLPCPKKAGGLSHTRAAEIAPDANTPATKQSDVPPPDTHDRAAVHAAHRLREPWLALESWEIDEDLRHMQRMLRGRRYVDSPRSDTELRIDAAAVSSTPSPEPVGPFAGFCAGLSRMLLLMGLTILVCGVSLLAWWHFGVRPDLCGPGLACTIVGQFLLMIGLAMQPERRGPAATESKPQAATFDHALLYADLSAEAEQPQSR